MKNNPKEQSFPREEDELENDGAYAEDDIEIEKLVLPDGKNSAAAGTPE
ncbi:MAG: hypothetical protein AB7G44_04370 [Bacteroidia bacterium]